MRQKSSEENNTQVDLIENILANFINKAKNTDGNKIVNIVEKILEFSSQEQGQGIEIPTLDQMLSRLPIFLANWAKAGNNSEKLKNEIRQLLYSLYRSKKTYKRNL